MKKLKEALIFIVSIVVLVFGPVVWYALQPTDGVVFVSNWNYLKMFFKDEMFLKALINTYTIPICVSFVVALTLFLVHLFVKKGYFAKRVVFYPICLASTSASAFVFIVMIVKEVNIFSVYNYLLSLQVGFLVTFLIWIIELIAKSILAKKGNKGK